ncbi:YegP family protein [Lacibacter cauensis]|nr:DUF1508 domain-containing protein [Lacibacter cauensis]
MGLKKIELHKDSNGEFYFVKYAGNGEAITKSSESYTRKENAFKAIVADTNITLSLMCVLHSPMEIPVIDCTGPMPVNKLIRFDENGMINVKDIE